MKTKKIITSLAVLLAVSTCLGGCKSNHKATNISKPKASLVTKKQNSKAKSQTAKKDKTSPQDDSNLANLSFQNGSYGYIKVNNDKSTLNPKDWKENKVTYANLDSLNRTSKPNIAYLEKRNLASDSLRVRQTVAPSGWHYNTRNGEQIYNRGHLIAYSVSKGIDLDGNYKPSNTSGDQNNPKNLFTQSAYSNQQLQTIYERKIRQALRQNKKVIFEAHAIFKGNEKMARGVHLQAISTDKTLNFNVFIFNVQNHYRFDYQTGRAAKDNSVVVKELPPELQSHYNNKNGRNRGYSNRKTFQGYKRPYHFYSKNNYYQRQPKHKPKNSRPKWKKDYLKQYKAFRRDNERDKHYER